MGRLSLLQWIFPTQESNQTLLRCRLILYHLSYQGSSLFSPFFCAILVKHIVSNVFGVYSVAMLALYHLASFSKLGRKSRLCPPDFVFACALTPSSALLLCIPVWNLSLLTCETPLGVFGQAALLAVYFLSIIIRNVFIVASFLKDSLAGYRIVGFLLVL